MKSNREAVWFGSTLFDQTCMFQFCILSTFQLSVDIDDLKRVIEDEKVLCSRLVDRVKLLTAKLSLT